MGKLYKITMEWVQRSEQDPTHGSLESLLEEASYNYGSLEVSAEELTPKRVYTCTYCGEKGHSRKSCPKLKADSLNSGKGEQ